MITDNICMGCMKEIGPEKQCPYCGYHADSMQLAPYLPTKTMVGGHYLVGKLLEYNGDGATYIGWDINRKAPITIREFLPDAIATRKANDLEVQVMAGCELTFSDCYHSFVDLWRKLARMRGLSALIVVLDIVEDYGTAYAISDYMEGVTLREHLLRSKYGYISWEQARILFMPVLSTLGTLHSAGIIHRGISPTTLIIGKDGKMHISGFSIWQARTARGDLTPQLFSGYAAIEQYGFKGQQGAWTDIYAFAAVLYRALIGSTPMEATERVTNDRLMVPGKFAEQLPAYVINALVNALQILPEDRTHSVEQLRAELSASPRAANAGAKYGQVTGEQHHKNHDGTNTTRKPVDQNIKKLATRSAIISAVAVLIVFIGAIAFIPSLRESIFGTSSSTDVSNAGEAEMVQVPNFVQNSSYAQILETELWQEQFKFVAEYGYSNTVPSGMIISQSVQPYTSVKKGTEIKIVVSRGVERIELPDVIGMDYAIALEQLEKLGFVCTKIPKANDGTQKGETIAYIDKTVGEKYEKGTELYIQVWTDPFGTTETSETTLQDTIF